MIGIYKFTNKITGEAYIGQSVNIQKRYIQHKNRYDIRGLEDTYFHSMLKHYGFDNFTFEILEECETNKLNEREIYYIGYYKTLYPNGYNKTPGGNLPHTNKLNDINDVDSIRFLLKNTNMTNIEIGELYKVSDQTISDINSGRIWYNDSFEYPIRDGRALRKTEFYCKVCPKVISNKTKTNLCRECFKKEMSKSLPCKDYLYSLLLNNSFTSVGQMFNVSSNAVKKWCNKYGIPSRASYYRSITC